VAIQEFAEGLLAKSRKEAKKSRRKSLLTAGLFLGVGIGNKVLRQKAAQRIDEITKAGTYALQTGQQHFKDSMSVLEERKKIMDAGEGNDFSESYRIWYRNAFLKSDENESGATLEDFRKDPKAWRWLQDTVYKATEDDIRVKEEQYQMAKNFEGTGTAAEKWTNYSAEIMGQLERLGALAGQGSDVGQRLMEIFRGNPKARMETFVLGGEKLKLPEGDESNNFINLLNANLEGNRYFDDIRGQFRFYDMNMSGYDALNLKQKTIQTANINVNNAAITRVIDRFMSVTGDERKKVQDQLNIFVNFIGKDGKEYPATFTSILNSLDDKSSRSQPLSPQGHFAASVNQLASMRHTLLEDNMLENREIAPYASDSIKDAVELLLAEHLTIDKTKWGIKANFTVPETDEEKAEWRRTLFELAMQGTPHSQEVTGHDSFFDSDVTVNNAISVFADTAGDNITLGIADGVDALNDFLKNYGGESIENQRKFAEIFLNSRDLNLNDNQIATLETIRGSEDLPLTEEQKDYQRLLKEEERRVLAADRDTIVADEIEVVDGIRTIGIIRERLEPHGESGLLGRSKRIEKHKFRYIDPSVLESAIDNIDFSLLTYQQLDTLSKMNYNEIKDALGLDETIDLTKRPPTGFSIRNLLRTNIFDKDTRLRKERVNKFNLLPRDIQLKDEKEPSDFSVLDDFFDIFKQSLINLSQG